MKKDWKNFINGLDAGVKFLHIDEFEKSCTFENPKYPCAFIQAPREAIPLNIFISKSEMDTFVDLDELKNDVLEKLENFELI